MRRPRLKPRFLAQSACYHCLSRVVEGRFALGEPEKDHLLRLIYDHAFFCGLRVLTCCVMSNHFHLLVEVPTPPEHLPNAYEVLHRYGVVAQPTDLQKARSQLEELQRIGDRLGVQAFLDRFTRRMWDLSAFMKLLKQRFTQWHNARSGRRGTLWEERYKSVLVESRGPALRAMAAYIDLNPVRAQLVHDPAAYRWSGYGLAHLGHEPSLDGLFHLARAAGRPRLRSAEKALELYREFLRPCLPGNPAPATPNPSAHPSPTSDARDQVLRRLQERERVSLHDYLQCRVRYFTDGMVLGSREFVESVFRAAPDRFGARRQTGARRMRGLADLGLFTARDLRLRVFE
ncbi:MAG: chemotaxis protein CheW [Verrucomicrobiales bacterium]|nr:chemotaxis protein CheW [Verrucomicrobiales bacterium]